MTENIVIDTMVFILTLVDGSKLNDEEKKQRPLVLKYMDGLEKGDYLVHLPRISVTEICGVARWKGGEGPAIAVKNRLSQWVSMGLIKLYDLDEDRMWAASDLAIKHNRSKNSSLSAPDAVLIGLAEELNTNLITFEKYFLSVSPKAEIPA
ncbi:MAG: PIN domain-containing protein [Chloroflexi bacterium]|nr:PIN domain-containing protein [Chloroflexota bacterium]